MGIITAFTVVSAQVNRNLSFKVNQLTGEIVLSVDKALHDDYGLQYPVTYEISIPGNSSSLRAYKRYSYAQDFTLVQEKTAEEFFNGIEAVRFEYAGNKAYLSVAFGSITDTIYIKFIDKAGVKTNIGFNRISKYYDNRRAAVTCTADDWHESFCQYFIESIYHLRKNHLWLSTGIVTDTGWCTESTWRKIQSELDSGYVEAVAHSRNHLQTPYKDVDYEVSGSKADIIKTLNLTPLFKKGDKEYVYVWVAPYGSYDDQTDNIVSKNKYLTARLTNENYNIFSAWEEGKNKFLSIGTTYEMGEATWGGTHDSITLNRTFDRIISEGNIYHLMFHPHVLAQYNSWKKGYVINHLEHISNRKDIWYTALGHLYLYHLLINESTSGLYGNNKNSAEGYALYPNYPNPFNPATNIRFSIAENQYVRLRIYDILGNEIASLVNEFRPAGSYTVYFDAGSFQSGVYISRLEAGSFSDSKKLLLIK